MSAAVREAFAIDVALTLDAGADSRAPGGEVSVALCGHWEHEGACRWPHNSRIDCDADLAHLRTVVIAPDEDRAEVVRRVQEQLRNDERWSVVQFATAPIADDERELAARLARSP